MDRNSQTLINAYLPFAAINVSPHQSTLNLLKIAGGLGLQFFGVNQRLLAVRCNKCQSAAINIEFIENPRRTAHQRRFVRTQFRPLQAYIDN